MHERKILEDIGWLNKKETPLIERLKFLSIEDNQSPHVNDINKGARDEVFQDYLTQEVIPQEIKDALSEDNTQDLLIGEIDRYGLPHRTVINLQSGLVRTNPYYDDNWLNNFYTKNYRYIYSNVQNTNVENFFLAQVSKGNTYYKFVESYVKPKGKILEIGCGMGGILIPFKLNGFIVKGIDLGHEFVSIGRRIELDLASENIDAVLKRGEKFDLVILSHLLEHIVDIENLLNKVKEILSIDGKLFIVVPGIRTIHTTYGGNIHTYLQNAHCWSFTEITLCALLSKLGFKIIKSNEAVFCLASVGSSNTEYRLAEESKSIIDYIKQTEADYLSNPYIKKPTLLIRTLRYLKRKILGLVK